MEAAGSSREAVVALMEAVREGDVTRAEQLLKSSPPATVNATDPNGWYQTAPSICVRQS
jgi:hypothetical protein